MAKFFKSLFFWVPFLVVFLLGAIQILQGSSFTTILSVLTSSLVAALISGLVIGGVVYMTFELSGFRRKR
ncbi:hypothetical protein CDO73_20055 [Saccharibacillus sp. O23]|uniref:hypothetical protein n=1 Tax=Saccharibacillus sp. O23 TaxID=2009338 RepID=UPI000B4E41AB|nr:hypothetical protein [Saccharibacillus sp. O23]OWR28176.1 hypothetical protein CDO73_20055 [Saccharibacillus sp. O23]